MWLHVFQCVYYSLLKLLDRFPLSSIINAMGRLTLSGRSRAFPPSASFDHYLTHVLADCFRLTISKRTNSTYYFVQYSPLKRRSNKDVRSWLYNLVVSKLWCHNIKILHVILYTLLFPLELFPSFISSQSIARYTQVMKTSFLIRNETKWRRTSQRKRCLYIKSLFQVWAVRFSPEWDYLLWAELIHLLYFISFNVQEKSA